MMIKMSAATNSSTSWLSNKLQVLVQVLRARFRAPSGPDGAFVARGEGFSDYPVNHGLAQLVSANSRSWRRVDIKGASNGMSSTNPSPPAPSPHPPRFSFPYWARWVLGSIISIVLPFWRQKLNKLQRIEGEAEMVIEEVEEVAKVVEKVANATEKFSEEVAENLPDNTVLKDAALMVERVSKATAEDAHSTLNFIHKVEELKEDLVDLETMVEPVVEKIAKHESPKK